MIKAFKIDGGIVRLVRSEGIFRADRVTYAHWDGFGWFLSSGRRPSAKELDAIDEIPMSLKTKS